MKAGYIIAQRNAPEGKIYFGTLRNSIRHKSSPDQQEAEEEEPRRKSVVHRLPTTGRLSCQ